MVTVLDKCNTEEQLGGKRFADAEEVETEVRNLLRQQPKTFMLRVSTH
jgi:hypothetical protein